MRIVFTGGPGAGKTTVAAALAAAEPCRFMVVPEAASAVYAALDTRWDKLDGSGRREVQRRIYRLQLEQESVASNGQIMLLDRGTVDGAAYWPDGAESYWLDLGTTHERELARYDAVVWMETAATLGIYDGCESNPCRFEDPAAAVATGRRLREVWSRHPRFRSVGACRSIDSKISALRKAIDELLPFR
jgi:predicted ATPase